MGIGADPTPLADYVASRVSLTPNDRVRLAEFLRLLPMSPPRTGKIERDAGHWFHHRPSAAGTLDVLYLRSSFDVKDGPAVVGRRKRGCARNRHHCQLLGPHRAGRQSAGVTVSACCCHRSRCPVMSARASSMWSFALSAISAVNSADGIMPQRLTSLLAPHHYSPRRRGWNRSGWARRDQLVAG